MSDPTKLTHRVPLDRLGLPLRMAAMPRAMAALPSADLTIPAVASRASLQTTIANAAAGATLAHPVSAALAALPAVDLTLPALPDPPRKRPASSK